jgi:hypothetical protein
MKPMYDGPCAGKGIEVGIGCEFLRERGVLLYEVCASDIPYTDLYFQFKVLGTPPLPRTLIDKLLFGVSYRQERLVDPHKEGIRCTSSLGSR